MANPKRTDLTDRELQVCALVAEGLTNKQIADRIYLTHWTVKTHVARILKKTGAVNRAGIAGLRTPSALPDRNQITGTIRQVRQDVYQKIYKPGSPDYYRRQGALAVLDHLTKRITPC